MKNFKTTLAVATMLCSGWVAPAMAQDAAQSEEAAPSPYDIIVTARRSEEKLQDVPLAVSVISPKVLESQGIVTPIDLAKRTPGLSVTASLSDRNNVTYNIRGQGYVFGTVFPAVITYFNEVPVNYLTPGSFFDLNNVQILRGPQGVEFGRVTDGGNVMVGTQAPKEDFGGYVSGKVGDYGLRSFGGAINVPIVEDKVLFRGAFETARRDGFTENVFNGKKLDNIAYEAYRGSLTIRPFEGFENRTVVQYQNVHENGTAVVYDGVNPAALGAAVGGLAFVFGGGYGIDSIGNVVPFVPNTGLTPFTAGNLVASQQAQLAAQKARGVRKVSLADPIYSNRDLLYVTNHTDIDLTDSLTLTNVFGFLKEKVDDASDFTPSNGAIVQTCHSACGGLPYQNQKQISEELRLTGNFLDNRLKLTVGGYYDKQSPAGAAENSTINVSILNRVNISNRVTQSRAIYGAADFAVTDHLSINGGIRYTHDSIKINTATYLSPVDGPAPRAALFNTLTNLAWLLGFPGTGAPGNEAGLPQGLPADVANAIVSQTFQPIPHGQCVNDYGIGGFFGGAGGIDCRSFDESFKVTTFTLGANYKTDDGKLFYIKYSKGYRPGGVNESAPTNLEPLYRPETDFSLEAGIKADFNFNGIFLRTNLAVFTDQYKSIQKIVVTPAGVGAPVSVIRNVDDARIRGVELEVLLNPAEGLSLNGTFNYIDAKYKGVGPFIDKSVAQSACDPTSTAVLGFCKDNQFGQTPKYKFSLGFDYRLPLPTNVGDLSIGAVLSHRSKIALSDSSKLNPLAVAPALTTIDATITWENVMEQPIDLGLFVTNLTDETYLIGTNDLSQRSSLGTRGYIYAAPRMWGASLKYRFGGDAN